MSDCMCAARDAEGGCFIETKSQVQALNSLSSRALDEIVDGTGDHQVRAGVICPKRDIAAVGVRNAGDRWPAASGQQSHEGCLRVGLLQACARIGQCVAGRQFCVDSGENASIKCHQVRRKQDSRARFLRHFWLMPMRQYAVRLQTDFAEETLDGRGAPSTAHA